MEVYVEVGPSYTKKVEKWEGPVKRFPSKEGERQRFNILFADGYKAEYCPLVSIITKPVKSGEEFTFRVKHRGEKGDEIERVATEAIYMQPSQPTQPSQPGKALYMSGHIATIALDAAIKWQAYKKPENYTSTTDTELMLSDVLIDAERIMEWLEMKAHNV